MNNVQSTPDPSVPLLVLEPMRNGYCGDPKKWKMQLAGLCGGAPKGGIRLPREWSNEYDRPFTVFACEGARGRRLEPNADRNLTYLDAANLVGASERSVRRWAKGSCIAAIPLNRLKRIRLSDVWQTIQDSLPIVDTDDADLAAPGRIGRHKEY